MTTGPTAAGRKLEPVENMCDLRESWSDLAAEHGDIFATWEWASTWWRHFGRGRRLLLHAARSPDGRLDILLPLYLWSTRPFRIARFLGHGPADQLGPVFHPRDRAGAYASLEDVVAQAQLDVLFAELLPGRGEWGSELGRSALARESSPTIALGDGWESYLRSRSANLRQQIRSRERRLSRRFRVRFRLADDASRLQDDLTTLFALHRQRWGPKSPFVRWEGFHRDFAAVALQQSWLRLWFLEIDGTPVAAWFGFRFAGVESYYQAGRDPRWADEAVGFVLLAHTIREAAEDGVREYRLLRGAEAFKLRFADDDPGLESFAIGRGVRGQVATSLIDAALRSAGLRAALRRLNGRALASG